MGVKPGYQHTEVGVIPEDWEAPTIQELLVRGSLVGHLDGNHGELYPRSHEFKEFGVPYITANDLRGDKVSFLNCKHLSEERARRFRKGVAKNGDVLFAHNATVGPTGLLSTNLDYVILSTTATYFRCNPAKILNSFLLYALQSPHFVSQYRAVMAQSTRNQVPITAQRKLSVVVPATKAEQEAIAATLSDADALIESSEQLLTKKRHVKQGAMQELLTGKRRLPGFAGEWEVNSLGSLCEVSAGEDLVKSDFSPTSDHRHQFPIYANALTNDGLYGYSRSYQYDADKITVTARGDVGHAVYRSTRFCAIGRLLVLSAKQSCDLRFITEHIANFVVFALESTGVPQLTAPQISQYAVAHPPTKDEQVAIATILSDMDADIAALEAKLVKARNLKQGMMQELLTGRIRLI